MTNATLPPSNLDQFKKEVLDRSPDAALPCNLSENWLNLLARDLECCVGENVATTSTNDYMAVPIAAILHLLSGKTDRAAETLRIEDIYEFFKGYRVEIALELVRRNTEIHPEPATIETIFTSRRVEFTRR